LFYVYILFSNSSQKYYCGQTNNLVKRINEHNNGYSLSTKGDCPWILIGFLKFESRAEAMKKEREIKQRGIKRWLEYSLDTLNKFYEQ